MADPYIGEIRMFAGTFAPKYWFMCNGSTLAIDDYQALYAIIGDWYGGDGRTSFKLPDLRGRAPVGVGRGSGLSVYWTQGMSVGLETITLASSNMPAHTHTTQAGITVEVAATTTKGTVSSPADDAVLAAGDVKEYTPQYSLENYITTPTQPEVSIKGAQAALSTQVHETGGGLSHNNMQKFTVTNYIICYSGIFPPRS